MNVETMRTSEVGSKTGAMCDNKHRAWKNMKAGGYFVLNTE
jgi:hypothetical protein